MRLLAFRLLLLMNSSCSSRQISKLLVVHPKIRLTAEQALEHPWFQGAQVCEHSAFNRNVHVSSLDFSVQNQLAVKQIGIENMAHHQGDNIILK